ncbi:MAG: tetratricopeptide repeat protein [Bacteriovoracaceae bacterium]|nr:tetratricopeptide repeat protein [Bacteriovoracaceae bacterium]
MQNIKQILIYSLCFAQIFVLGCANILTQSDDAKKPTAEEVQTAEAATTEENNQKIIEEVSGKIQELAKAAKASGPEAVQFLASDLFLKANSSQLEEDYVTANFLYQHLLELVPDEVYLHKKYAISLIKSGDLKTAEASLLYVHKHDPEDKKMGLILAGVQSSLGKLKEAEKIYVSILKTEPNNKDACLFLSKVYTLDGKIEKAHNLLSDCQKRFKKEGDFTYYIGKMYLEKGQIDKSLKYFEAAYAIDPQLSEAAVAAGVIYEEQGKTDKAISLYRKHLKINPEDEMILERVVQLLFSLERFEEVVGYAEKLSDIQSDNLNLKVKLGILYSDTKQYEKALSTFKDLLAYAPESDRILYYLAAIYQEMNSYDDAVNYFSKIKPESALYHDSIVQVAYILSSLTRDPAAQGGGNQKFLTYIDEKIQANKEIAVELSLIKANFFEARGNYKEAVSTLEKIKSLPEFTNSHKYYLASLLEREKEFDKSITLMLEVVESEPKNAHAWNFIGYSYIERGLELEKAYEYITKAVSLAPKDGYIRDSLGWYYFKMGNYPQALKELQQASKHAPGDPTITKHLGQIYQAMHKYEDAKKYYHLALKACKEESDRLQIMKHLEEIESFRVPAAKKK